MVTVFTYGQPLSQLGHDPSHALRRDPSRAEGCQKETFALNRHLSRLLDCNTQVWSESFNSLFLRRGEKLDLHVSSGGYNILDKQIIIIILKEQLGTSLVVQWLRIRLAVKGSLVRSLVRELRFPHAVEQLSHHATISVHVLQRKIPRDTMNGEPMSQHRQINKYQKKRATNMFSPRESVTHIDT